MNKEYLRKKCYKMGNSQLPIDVFYNDIRDNPNPNFNKDEAYADLKKIVDYIEKIQNENQELKNNILSLELDTCIPKLRQENNDLKKVIKILKDKIELPLENDFDVVNKDDIHLYRLRTKCLISEEEYELLKEALNER